MTEETLIRQILTACISDETLSSKREFQRIQNDLYREVKLAEPLSSTALIRAYRIGIKNGEYPSLGRVWKLLRKRPIRSLSGISVISLLTKFWGCPGKCVFCPTFENLPKSYVPNEPAVMRAEMNAFDPVKQVQNRLKSLESTGHAVSKCDVRVIGGTWTVYPKEYQESVMKGIYDGHTLYEDISEFVTDEGETAFREFKAKKSYEMHASKTLEEAKSRNETADCRVIGIAIETRPDWIDEDEIKRLRSYGVTRVEIGYQTTIDAINETNKRGHGNTESIRATKLLKDAGFKVVAHMMPNLLGSTPELDRESMHNVFESSDFRPDEMKIYPMVVTDHSELTEIWKNGGFQPYEDETLIDLMADLEAMLPEYVRLNRAYRDIPANMILAGCTKSNLRELTMQRMVAKWVVRKDISAREIRAKWNIPANAVLEELCYEASGGKEYFLQFIDPEDRTVFSLLRLRIPSQVFTGEKHYIEALQDAAIVREVHTFGDQLPIGAAPDGTGQHQGFGKRLMARAEEIVRENYPGISKLAVISGVGVRGYYRKLGYELIDEYMVKGLV